MNLFFLIISIILLLNAIICFIRVIKGPSILDRLVAINIIGTKTLIILILVAYFHGQKFYIDIAFVYALLNFVVTVAISKIIEIGGTND
ncbi:MAG: cation:proton antiporter [Candidatus Firestonebacteria bacterium]|nr:cation:proton antiporter [Candidatus Firestonebacteria bacterium]